MAKVRRLDALVHIEDGFIRDVFDIEDARGKLNGCRALYALLQHEYRRRDLFPRRG
jgi:hypothetical protein